MTHTVLFDNTKLQIWYDAVCWGKTALQQRIAQKEAMGYPDVAWDISRVEQLEDLEQFLKMNWDQWMESLGSRQTAVEENK